MTSPLAPMGSQKDHPAPTVSPEAFKALWEREVPLVVASHEQALAAIRKARGQAA